MPILADTLATADGSCRLTLAVPDGTGPWPAAVMYPDAGGARETFTAMAAELAGSGYVVLVPDVYYRHPGWAPFAMDTAFTDPAERTRIFALMRSVTPQRMAADAAAFFDYLAARPQVAGDSFGVCGYCMGGRTALVVAGRLGRRVAAAASFHGGGLVTDAADSPHRAAADIRAAVYVAGAQDDATFTAAQARRLDEELRAAGVEHTVEIFPAAHGFAVPDNPTYDPQAAERHWTALRAFFAARLTG
ncbi:MAG TPA: dienelactone hydrolase family protein [Mycolicibacillus parakoreensis]|nr:dienelactone hydrolase family protein [Mycolicibacillus parakoreensis]